jgi:hypothetical protein
LAKVMVTVRLEIDDLSSRAASHHHDVHEQRHNSLDEAAPCRGYDHQRAL